MIEVIAYQMHFNNCKRNNTQALSHFKFKQELPVKLLTLRPHRITNTLSSTIGVENHPIINICIKEETFY